jgi:hypothetical protein
MNTLEDCQTVEDLQALLDEFHNSDSLDWIYRKGSGAPVLAFHNHINSQKVQVLYETGTSGVMLIANVAVNLYIR